MTNDLWMWAPAGTKNTGSTLLPINQTVHAAFAVPRDMNHCYVLEVPLKQTVYKFSNCGFIQNDMPYIINVILPGDFLGRFFNLLLIVAAATFSRYKEEVQQRQRMFLRLLKMVRSGLRTWVLFQVAKHVVSENALLDFMPL